MPATTPAARPGLGYGRCRFRRAALDTEPQLMWLLVQTSGGSRRTWPRPGTATTADGYRVKAISSTTAPGRRALAVDRAW